MKLILTSMHVKTTRSAMLKNKSMTVYQLLKAESTIRCELFYRSVRGVPYRSSQQSRQAHANGVDRESVRCGQLQQRQEAAHPLIKAALAYQGAAFIDVLSPCVAFNNHANR